MGERVRKEWPEALMNAPVQFWKCLQPDHKTVTWEGNVATCPTCGLTSDMTRKFALGVVRYERERIRQLATDRGAEYRTPDCANRACPEVWGEHVHREPFADLIPGGETDG